MTSWHLFSTFDILRSISGFSDPSPASPRPLLVIQSRRKQKKVETEANEWGALQLFWMVRLKMMQPFLLVPRSWGNKKVVVWIHKMDIPRWMGSESLKCRINGLTAFMALSKGWNLPKANDEPSTWVCQRIGQPKFSWVDHHFLI